MWTATQLVRIRYSSFGVSGSTRRPLPIEMIDAFEPRAPFGRPIGAGGADNVVAYDETEMAS